jgi:hypothetical protein
VNRLRGKQIFTENQGLRPILEELGDAGHALPVPTVTGPPASS